MTDNMSSILKQAKDLFGKEFVLCYRDPHSLHWTCETGYKTLEDVDNRKKQFPQVHNAKTTTFFTSFHGTPDFLRRQWIKKQLMPSVLMMEKPNH